MVRSDAPRKWGIVNDRKGMTKPPTGRGRWARRIAAGPGVRNGEDRALHARCRPVDRVVPRVAIESLLLLYACWLALASGARASGDRLSDDQHVDAVRAIERERHRARAQEVERRVAAVLERRGRQEDRRRPVVAERHVIQPPVPEREIPAARARLHVHAEVRARPLEDERRGRAAQHLDRVDRPVARDDPVEAAHQERHRLPGRRVAGDRRGEQAAGLARRLRALGERLARVEQVDRVLPAGRHPHAPVALVDLDPPAAGQEPRAVRGIVRARETSRPAAAAAPRRRPGARACCRSPGAGSPRPRCPGS